MIHGSEVASKMLPADVHKLMRRLMDLRQETNRAINCVQVGADIPSEFWDQLRAIQRDYEHS